jgi:hypothetical protein
MSRYNPQHDSKPVSAAASQWARRCLAEDGSVLSTSDELWTLNHLDELDRVYVQNPDFGGAPFLQHWSNSFNRRNHQVAG